MKSHVVSKTQWHHTPHSFPSYNYNSAVTVTEPKPKTAVFCQNRGEPLGFLEPSEDGFVVRRLYLYCIKHHEQMDGWTYKYAVLRTATTSTAIAAVTPCRRLMSCGLC